MVQQVRALSYDLNPSIVERAGLHAALDRLAGPDEPVLLDHDGPDIHRHSPVLGEHSEQLLTELGYSKTAIGELAAAGVTRLASAKGGARSSEAAE